ncbi:MAG: energy transducer TonB [Terriglobales bacterium]
MADLPPKPDFESRFLLEHESGWRSFINDLKDFLRREKPPELTLESKPIPVKDIWAPPRSLRSRLGSAGLHVAILGILMLPFWRPVRMQIKKAAEVVNIYTPDTAPPMPVMHHLAGGGAPVIRPTLKLQTPRTQTVVAPTALIPLQDALTAPAFGSVGPVSGPPGAGAGSGTGSGGVGNGEVGGTCTSGPCGTGTGVTSPVLIYQPQPEYSDAARKAKFQGTCIVDVIVNADGSVGHAKVVQPLGLGLDQKAIEAVLKWRFRPARDKNGKPVAVMAEIEVNFRLY